MRYLPYLLLFSLLLSVPSVQAEHITIKKINGKPWLIDAEGKPFFAHGVTHISAKGNANARKIGTALKDLGFNSYGYGCPPTLKSDMPYVQGLNNLIPMSLYFSGRSFHFADVFDPKVISKLQGQIKQLCNQNKDNPTLIGYCWTDLAAWPLENTTGKNWVEYMRKLPDQAPGKQAYNNFIESWQGEAGTKRDLAFLRLIARQYFKVLGEANKKYDPNHLIFGDRLTLKTAIPEVVEEMLPYVDAIAIQPPFQKNYPKAAYDRIHKMSGGKPILICDFAIRFKEEGKNIRGWKPESGPKAAGQVYTDYIKAAMNSPYIIGSFWCQPVNQVARHGKNGAIKQGIFAEDFTPRIELNKALKQLNLHIASAAPKQSPS